MLENISHNRNTNQTPSSSHNPLHDWIQREVVEGSGVSPELASVATAVYPDLVIKNGEVADTPIHNALNWKYTRYGRQSTISIEGLFFFQESGEVFQIKLSKQREDKNSPGKYIKYETPVGNKARAYLPPIDPVTRKKISERIGRAVPMEGSFWQWVKENLIPVILTEGPKKALSLLSDGYIAIALNGVNGGYRVKDEMGRLLAEPELIPDLQEFNWKQRTVFIANDAESDDRKQSKVGTATNRFGALLAKEDALVYAASWRASEGKGVDDLKVNQGFGRVVEAITRARPIKQKRLTKLQIAMMFARSEGVQLNQLTWRVELNGEPIKLSEHWCKVCESSGLEVSKDYFIDAYLAVAAENGYHPIVRYLESLGVLDDPRSYLIEFFAEYLGLDKEADKFQIELCIKWAIGAVKRMYEPGCFLKNMLILKGDQNAGKSSFFRYLAGNDWFGDPEQMGNAKDDAIIPHMCWIVESSEVETVYKRKDVSELKARLSRTFDMVRRPYARDFEKIERRYVDCGTTNKSTFLHDSTGSVRFWIVELERGFKIPFKSITEEVRSRFWAAVRTLYKAGESTEPTEDQWVELNESNKKFQASQDFEAYVLRYIESGNRNRVSTTAIREYLQEKMPKGDRIPSGIAIKEFLDGLGWDYSPKLVTDENGRKARMLTAPSAPPSQEISKHNWKEGDSVEVLNGDGAFRNGFRVETVVGKTLQLRNPMTGATAEDTVDSPYIRPCTTQEGIQVVTQQEQETLNGLRSGEQVYYVGGNPDLVTKYGCGREVLTIAEVRADRLTVRCLDEQGILSNWIGCRSLEKYQGA